VHRGYTFDFRCERKIVDLQSAWSTLGPYRWQAFENDEYGAYIVAREPETNLKIRVLGEAPQYSLEMDFDVHRNLIRQTKSRLFADIFERLLPAVGATAIRETTWETQTSWVRRLFRQLKWRVQEW
jgi:hypothetical protein